MQPLNGNYLFKLCIHTLFCTLFFLVINYQDCSNGALAGGSLVNFLPGFDGPLPFELETGYIGVGETEDVQLFYYFTKSEGNPAKDPLLLWFTGGPGCSSFCALIYEIGPIKIAMVRNDGSLPKLILNPFSWTKVANIIFIDYPVGSGFTYARNTKAPHLNDLQSSHLAIEFFRKWLVDHPQFISNQVYVGGDSYSGITVPIITQLISDGNELGLEPKIDLKGYVLGNPKSSPDDSDYRVQYANGMGLISDELFKSLKETCGGKYHDIDSKNTLCLQNMKTFHELLRYINEVHILTPICRSGEASSRNRMGGTRSRMMHEMYQSEVLKLEIREEEEEGFRYECHDEMEMLSEYWANDENVQEAIHVRKGTIGVWKQCNLDLPFVSSVTNSVPYHANLSIKGYRSLIYSGDHDLMFPFTSTEAWIKSLNYSIVDDWRSWIVDGQVAGYTRTFANRMTFATVKGGGHTAPEYKPAECRAMFERWISYQPL